MIKRVFDKKILKNRLIKNLVKEIKRLGYSIEFVPSWRQIGFFDAYGAHYSDLNTKIIYCTRYRKNGTRRTVGDIAFILAHELRHALHLHCGLYTAYYVSLETTSLLELSAAVAVGMRAELDCDRYARKRLKDANIYSTLLHRRYPLQKVGMYLQYRRKQLAANIEQRRKRGLPIDNHFKKLEKTFEYFGE